MAMTETEMKDADVPWPRSIVGLARYILRLVRQKHDYGTCVYAMSMAAAAAFHYVAGKLGVTGFQASCADLDFIRRTRHLKGPFMLVKVDDLLYPQYDKVRDLRDFIDSSDVKKWLRDEAQKLLAENAGSEHVSPVVRRHWEDLATTPVPEDKSDGE